MLQKEEGQKKDCDKKGKKGLKGIGKPQAMLTK